MTDQDELERIVCDAGGGGGWGYGHYRATVMQVVTVISCW